MKLLKKAILFDKKFLAEYTHIDNIVILCVIHMWESFSEQM